MSKSWTPRKILGCRPDLFVELMKSEELDITNPKILDRHPNRRRRSPIMVEFADPETTVVDIQRAMEAGMNIAKFKMAFSTKEEKIAILSRVDKAAERCAEKMGVDEWPVATCATLKTLMVKTGVFADDINNVVLMGSEVILSNDRKLIQQCRSDRIFIDYAHMKDIKVGMEITLDQAEVVLVCITEIDDSSIKCKVTKGGTLKDLRPVSIRNLVHTTPYISQKDIDILKFCLKYQESDGIILSRDYLPYELDNSKVFRMAQIQKWIAGKCQQAGKPLFLAGAVFKHALEEGRFSDHELADISNALLDGVTGFVLRDCTDIKHTLAAIRVLNDVCCTIEPFTFHKDDFFRIIREPKLPVNAAEAAAIACVAVANQTKARIIIIPTVSGRTPRVLLWLRPTCIVITVSSAQNVTRRLFTCRNIVPLVYKGNSTNPKLQNGKRLDRVMERVRFAAEFAVTKGWLVYGDIYISLQRSSEGNPFCDMVRIWSVDFLKKLLIECNYTEDQFAAKRKPSEAVEEEIECQIKPEDKDAKEKGDSKVQKDAQKATEEKVSEKAAPVKEEIKVEVKVEKVKEEPLEVKQEEVTPTEAKQEIVTPVEENQEEVAPVEEKQDESTQTETKEGEATPPEAKPDEATPTEAEKGET